MKLSFACFSAMLGPVVALENEAQQQPLAASTPLLDKGLESSKKNMSSFYSPFSKVKDTSSYKKLLHRSNLHREPSKIHNIKPVTGVVADDNAKDGNMMASGDVAHATTGLSNNAGTNVDRKEYTLGSFDQVYKHIEDVNSKSEAESDVNGDTLKTAENSMDANGVAISNAVSSHGEEYTFGSFDKAFSYDNQATVSDKEACVPPFTIPRTSELDAGNLPLSSCSSKKHICINSNSNNKKEVSGVCLDLWDVPTTYFGITDPKIGVVQSTYWEEPYFIGIAATHFTQKEEDTAYEEHHVDNAGDYAHDSSSSGVSKNVDVPMTYMEDYGSAGVATAATPFIHKEYLSLQRYYHEEEERHLQISSNTPTSAPTVFDCEDICAGYRPVINVSGADFQNLVTSCVGVDTNTCKYNGTITCWDTSLVTSMKGAFLRKKSFNSVLNCWNVSQVATMFYTFFGASSFNQPLDKWDVGQVTDMKTMFYRARSFNQPLDKWDVGRVTNMYGMFAYASKFNQLIDNWDVGQVSTTGTMFRAAFDFNQPLDSWNVSQVNNMRRMFSSASSFNQPLDIWDVSQVNDMSIMFYYSSRFNQCLSTWAEKTSNYVDTIEMLEYSGCTNRFYKVYPDVGPWCRDEVNDECIASSSAPSTSSVPSLSLRPSVEPSSSAAPSSFPSVFDCDLICGDPPPAINVSGVEFQNLVSGCILDDTIGCFDYGPIICWNTSLVNSMKRAFYSQSGFNTPLECWNVGQVTDMYNMFKSARKFNQPIDNWDVSRVNNMSGMFFDSFSFNQPLDIWDVSQVYDMSIMFYYSYRFNQCLSTWAEKTSNYVDTDRMLEYSGCTNRFYKVYPDVGPWCRDEVNDECIASSSAPSTSSAPSLSLRPSVEPSSSAAPSSFPSVFDCDSNCGDSPPAINVSGVGFQNLVSGCILDDTIGCLDYGPIVCWNTSLVTSMKSAFIFQYGFNTPLECWNVGRVTDMYGMFRSALKFNQPIDNWDVGQVSTTRNMFFRAYDFNQPLDSWNVGQVTNTRSMFAYAYSFNQPLDVWDVSKVAGTNSMTFMFFGGSRGLSSFDQCLSTWADKTSDEVDTRRMLENSKCPNKYANPTYGPWCQYEVNGCIAPSSIPSSSLRPSGQPSMSAAPSTSTAPSILQILSMEPSTSPSQGPTDGPTDAPSPSASAPPSLSFSVKPSTTPSQKPTDTPTDAPTATPTATPSKIPTGVPTKSPTQVPTNKPTRKKKFMKKSKKTTKSSKSKSSKSKSNKSKSIKM